MDPQQSQEQAMHVMMAIFPVIAFFALAFSAFMVFAFWRIFVKAGMAGPLAFLVFIPAIGPLVVVCILAFGRWNVVPAPPAYLGGPPVYPPTGYPPQGPPQY